jgi:hypothetical protein
MEMILTSEAAEILGISKRQIARLAASGELDSITLSNGLLQISVKSVIKRKKFSSQPGRPLSSESAWAIISLLSGSEPNWIDKTTRNRYISKLLEIVNMSEENALQKITWLCKSRSKTIKTYRTDVKYISQIQTLEDEKFKRNLNQSNVIQNSNIFDSYVNTSFQSQIEQQFFLAEDSKGNVILRMTDFPLEKLSDDKILQTAKFLDMIESLDTRTNSEGTQKIFRLLDEFSRNNAPIKVKDLTINLDQLPDVWKSLMKISETFENENWILVGGLMTSLKMIEHNIFARATRDIDILIDVLSDRKSLERCIKSLKTLGFVPKHPSWKGAPLHRFVKGELIIDLLVADHLPRKIDLKYNSFPLMAIEGGAQAIDRKMFYHITSEEKKYKIPVPDDLGSLILKSAAYKSDTRDSMRHLEDSLLLASIITDYPYERSRLQGSDQKRLLKVLQGFEEHRLHLISLTSTEVYDRALQTVKVLAK